MYYVFSNANKLMELANQKKWEELMVEVKNSQMVIPETYKGVCPSAKEVYRIICETIFEDGKQELLTCSKHVSKMFADCWEIEGLSMIVRAPAKYGEAHEDAFAVLKDYQSYKALTLAEFEANKNAKEFEKEIEGIKIVFKSGRLSFYRNGMEYLIFRNVSY